MGRRAAGHRPRRAARHAAGRGRCLQPDAATLSPRPGGRHPDPDPLPRLRPGPGPGPHPHRHRQPLRRTLPACQYPISNLPFPHPGEYRVDLTARYTDPDGTLYMGAMTWGGVVMTPDAEADLVAHGRRGLDSLQYIPNHWFVASRDLTIPAGAISHTWNPYYNGDMLWTRMSDGPCGGDSLLLGASVQDTVGVVEAAIADPLRADASRAGPARQFRGPGGRGRAAAVYQHPLGPLAAASDSRRRGPDRLQLPLLAAARRARPRGGGRGQPERRLLAAGHALRRPTGRRRSGRPGQRFQVPVRRRRLPRPGERAQRVPGRRAPAGSSSPTTIPTGSRVMPPFAGSGTAAGRPKAARS